MEHRRLDEDAARRGPRRMRSPVPTGLELPVLMIMAGDALGAALGDDHGGVRAEPHQGRQAAGMVRLGVVGDHEVDLRRIDDRADVRDEFLLERPPDRVHQRDLFVHGSGTRCTTCRGGWSARGRGNAGCPSPRCRPSGRLSSVPCSSGSPARNSVPLRHKIHGHRRDFKSGSALLVCARGLLLPSFQGRAAFTRRPIRRCSRPPGRAAQADSGYRHEQTRTDGRLLPDAARAQLRDARRRAIHEGPHRRVLPSVLGRGGGGRRRAGAPAERGLRDRLLPRPRLLPHPRRRPAQGAWRNSSATPTAAARARAARCTSSTADINFFGGYAIVAGMCPIAVGSASHRQEQAGEARGALLLRRWRDQPGRLP